MDAEALGLLALQASHILTRSRRDGSGKQRWIISSTLADRQRLKNCVADYLLDDRVLRVQNRSLAGDRNRLRYRSRRELEIQRCREPRGDFNALALRHTEASLARRHLVNARRQVYNSIQA